MRNNFINPEEVKTWTLDILKYMKDHPEQEFFAYELGEIFDLLPDAACKRLSKLRRWGMVKLVSRKRPYTYAITPWGIKFLNDKKEEETHDR